MTTKYIRVEAEVDLDEWSDEELVEEMEKRRIGTNHETAFDHVDHLLVCGQVEAATNEALRIVSEIIGRPFK